MKWKKARWLPKARWWNFLCPPYGHVAMRPCAQQPRLEHLVHSLLANTDFPKSEHIMSLIFFMVKVYEVKCSELLSGLLTQSSGQIVFWSPWGSTMWSLYPEQHLWSPGQAGHHAKPPDSNLLWRWLSCTGTQFLGSFEFDWQNDSWSLIGCQTSTGSLCLLDSWTRDCRVKTQHNMSFTVLLNIATDACPLNKIR